MLVSNHHLHQNFTDIFQNTVLYPPNVCVAILLSPEAVSPEVVSGIQCFPQVENFLVTVCSLNEVDVRV